jgi:hypothetical protein
MNQDKTEQGARDEDYAMLGEEDVSKDSGIPKGKAPARTADDGIKEARAAVLGVRSAAVTPGLVFDPVTRQLRAAENTAGSGMNSSPSNQEATDQSPRPCRVESTSVQLESLMDRFEIVGGFDSSGGPVPHFQFRTTTHGMNTPSEDIKRSVARDLVGMGLVDNIADAQRIVRETARISISEPKKPRAPLGLAECVYRQGTGIVFNVDHVLMARGEHGTDDYFPFLLAFERLLLDTSGYWQTKYNPAQALQMCNTKERARTLLVNHMLHINETATKARDNGDADAGVIAQSAIHMLRQYWAFRMAAGEY